MQELKLLLLEKGDSQKNLVDKVNFNFSQVISFEGGPYGKIGPEGKSGNPGSTGPQGSFGIQGERGNIWTVSITEPVDPLDGDYWMNPLENNEIRVYNSGSWDLYSININTLGIFRDFGPLQTPSGISSKRGYFTSLAYPILNTLVLSDSSLSDGSTVANPQYSKVVISTDSQNSDRRILEFTKGDYQGGVFDSISPHFYWNPGPTSTNGNYGLNFLSPGGVDFNSSGNVTIKSIIGSITLSGGDSSSLLSEFYYGGSFSLNSYNGNSRIISDTGSGYFLLESSNLRLPSTSYPRHEGFVPIDIQTSGTTGSQASLNVVSNIFNLGNLYYKMDEIYPSTRAESYLFKSTNSSNDSLEISGRGDFKVNKTIYPLQPLVTTVPVLDGSIRYSVFTPTVSLNGQTATSSFNVSRGVDYYSSTAIIAGSSRGISLWTPATGGSSYSDNGGWLNILGDSEYFNFRIHWWKPEQSTTEGFRYIGINTTETKNNNPGSGTQIHNLGSGNYCHSVEFTIMNISSTAGGTGGTNRWFKVLYQAYGGNLPTPVCGHLYTNGSTP
jgi:hypothetical protein